MTKKHPLLTGALILTLTGIVTKFIGFFYKIFLSRTIGAEGMGLYQMIFPIFGICFSLTATGIETSISRFVACESAKGNHKGARKYLYAGLFLSAAVSSLMALLLHRGAAPIAISYLKESRCTPLLQMLALALPFSACHACICGYYYGIKQTTVPAFSQLFEQLVRVGTVYLLASIYTEKSLEITPLIAVAGLAAGEFISTLFCISAYSFHISRYRAGGDALTSKPFTHSQYLKQILRMSLPLTGNRVATNLLASLEAVLIPLTLKASGLSAEESYQVYGTLTGMALSFIFFPNVLTGSISVLLLPSISESQASGNRRHIADTIRKTILFCLPFGIFCSVFFLLTGSFLGTFFFHSKLAGDFICTLAWICPFLYLNATLNSILHGLGLTGITFRNNMIGITVRILFILLCVPPFGIQGYLWGILANQLLITFLCLCALKQFL